MKNETGKLYGIYSHGNQYEYYFTDKQKKIRKKVVADDLRKANFSLKRLNNSVVMNVGTGRESYALQSLGAKNVFHYDISKEHVNKFKKIIKNDKIENISSKNLDLCKKKIPEEFFDFVYLNGIVHHFSYVDKGLDNCARSVKLNGKIWLYFYRSGTFKWFVCQMIRELINESELDDYFKNSSTLFSYGSHDNASTTRIMDDFFAPFIWLYTPKMYCDFMKKYGFVLEKKINSKNFKSIDFKNLHHSSILVFKRTKLLKSNHIPEILNNENSIDQLNSKIYKDERTKLLIKNFKKLKSKLLLKNNKTLKFAFLISLHKIAAPQYYGENELPPKMSELEVLIKNTKKNLN